jgi:nitrite reductase/ring-hydroxylating ferredoxin subunit
MTSPQILSACPVARVGETWEIEPGGIRRIDLPGRPAIALVRLEEGFFAVDDRCTHGDASLSDGEVEDGNLVCPFHGGAFDVRTGQATRFPCTEPVQCYAVEIRGEEIFVRLDGSPIPSQTGERKP